MSRPASQVAAPQLPGQADAAGPSGGARCAACMESVNLLLSVAPCKARPRACKGREGRLLAWGLDKARYSTLLFQFNCRLFFPVSRQLHTSCLRLSPLQASRSYMDSALPQILYPGLSTRLTHRTVWGFGSRASDSLHSSTPTPALSLSLTLALTPTQHGSPSRSRSRSRPLQWH
jgi:hypothetical protein